MDPLTLELVRTIADVAASLAITIGLPLLLAWGVRKHIIQQRWVAVIEAAAGAGFNAGRVAGPINSRAFLAAAAVGILAYVKGQAADVLKAKKMSDDATVEAGLARLSRLTDGAVGPAGTAQQADVELAAKVTLEEADIAPRPTGIPVSVVGDKPLA